MTAPPAVTRFLSGRYRWWIGGLLFLSTVINYLHRQILSVLAPILRHELNLTNTQYAYAA